MLPTQSVCLVVPVVRPSEYDEPAAARQAAHARAPADRGAVDGRTAASLMDVALRIGGEPLVVLRAGACRDGPGVHRGHGCAGARTDAAAGAPAAPIRRDGGRDRLAARSPTRRAPSTAGRRTSPATPASASAGRSWRPTPTASGATPLADRRAIETRIAGAAVRLPRNWGGRAPGAEQYAMHGLILDARVAARQGAADRVSGRFDAGDFDGRWPGRADLRDRMAAGRRGACPARGRRQRRRQSPRRSAWAGIPTSPSSAEIAPGAAAARGARSRVVVNNYDEVLPTGELEPVVGGPYDFRTAAGRRARRPLPRRLLHRPGPRGGRRAGRAARSRGGRRSSALLPLRRWSAPSRSSRPTGPSW